MSTHYCNYPRTVGPASVDDPAPYRETHDWRTGKVIFGEPLMSGNRSQKEINAERRLTIAAQFMAAGWREILNGTDRAWMADQSLAAADALIARWKETT